MSLTPKQEHFARAYVLSGNATQAYRQAYDTNGAPDSTVNTEAYRLTIHPEIAPRIRALMDDAFDAAGYSPETVLRGIRAQIDMATADSQHSPAMRGWELLGKWRNMFDATSVTVDNSQHLNVLRDMDDDALRALIAATAPAPGTAPGTASGVESGD
jgi:hypothetical protein